MKKIICLLFIVLLVCGCSDGSKKTQATYEKDVQSNNSTDIKNEISEDDNSFNIEKFPKIKQIVEQFNQNLIKHNVEPMGYECRISKYVNNSYYKTVTYTFDNENITLKFSDTEELLSISLSTVTDVGKNISITYMNARISIMQFDYFSFSKQEQDIIIEMITGIEPSEKKIREWTISNPVADYDTLHFHVFTISKK